MAPRPREFDTDTVLEAAMRAFWTHGYEATSMTDLIKVTGLQKGSLYKAFGDKHSLFLQTLARYMEIGLEEKRKAAAEVEGAIEKLDHIFMRMMEKSRESECCGCYAANTLVELSQHDPEAAALLQEHTQELSDFYVPILAQGQKEGTIRRDQSAEDLFQFYMIFMIGLASFSKGVMTDEQAVAQKDLFLQMLKV